MKGQKYGWICLLALALTMLGGCGDGAIAEGKQLLADGKEMEAAARWEQAVLDGESVYEAHCELANLYERLPGRRLLACWHYSQALSLLPEEHPKRPFLASSLADCRAALSRELEIEEGGRSGDNLRLKVELLEEHARQQSKWLDELRRENAHLRRELSELQGQ